MTRWIACLILLARAAAAASQAPPPPDERTAARLPDAAQAELIRKTDYGANLKDLARLHALAESIENDLKKNQGQVLSLANLKKLDQIEALARRIRGRMKRY